MKTVIDPQKAAIGSRIAAARKKKGLSQEQLALQLGVTTSAVGQWERGFTMPKMSIFDRIPDLLDTNREYLLTGGQDEEKRQAQDVLELEILRLNRKMSLRQRMDLIRSMAGLVGDEGDE